MDIVKLMKYKLHCNKQSLNALKTKYKITNYLIFKYIELSNYNDINQIQELLDKTIIVSSTDKSVTVLD